MSDEERTDSALARSGAAGVALRVGLGVLGGLFVVAGAARLMGNQPVLASVYMASLGAMGLLIALWPRRMRPNSHFSEVMPLTGIALAQWSIGWVAAGIVILLAGLVVGGVLVPIAILALLGSLYLGRGPVAIAVARRACARES